MTVEAAKLIEKEKRRVEAADSLRAELTVNRRLLAAFAATSSILARYIDLDSDQILELLGPLRKDSRLTSEAANAAIAYVAVELAKSNPRTDTSAD